MAAAKMKLVREGEDAQKADGMAHKQYSGQTARPPVIGNNYAIGKPIPDVR